MFTMGLGPIVTQPDGVLLRQGLDHDYTSPQGPRTRSQFQRMAHIMLRAQTEATDYKADFKPGFVFLIT